MYDQYDFGLLHGFDKKVVLADDSWKQPRGVVKDVMIQLGEFYYPVDSLVLDYAPTRMTEQQKVILGRSFLHTANAQINCRDGLITMSSDNRKLIFNVCTKSITYDVVDELCETVATNESVPPYTSRVCEDTLDENGVELYRSAVEKKGEHVKKVNERKREKIGKPPDGGNAWGNEAKFDFNGRVDGNVADFQKPNYLEKSGGKHAFEPP